MRLKFSHFLFILSVFFIISCNDTINRVDTSAILMDLNFERFEIAMFSIADEGINEKELIDIENRFSKFYPIYVGPVMRFGETGLLRF